MITLAEKVRQLIELDSLGGCERNMLFDVMDTIQQGHHVSAAREMRVDDLWVRFCG